MLFLTPLMSCGVIVMGQSPTELSSAIDTDQLVTTTPAAPWFVETNVTHDGVLAAQSASLITMPSVLSMTVEGGKTIKFWWKVSTSPNYGGVTFKINGVSICSISGDVDWQRRSCDLPPGPQSLEWNFNINGTGGYKNCVWLDEVTFGEPDSPSIAFNNTNIIVSASDVVTLSPTVFATEPFHCQWYFKGEAISKATSASLTITNIQAINAGLYSIDVTNNYGYQMKEISVQVAPTAPILTKNPISQSAHENTTLVLESAFKGTEPIQYQWFLNGVSLDAMTNAACIINGIQPHNYGNYWVIASNSKGTGTSALASVSWTPLVIWGQTNTTRDLSYYYSTTAPRFIPPEATNLISFAAGDGHCVGLHADGTVFAWGVSGYGGCIVPEGFTNVNSITAGCLYSAALQGGRGMQFGGKYDNKSKMLSNATDLIKLGLGSGAQHIVALCSDGSVIDDGFEKLKAGLGYSSNLVIPNNLVDVAAGSFHGVGVTGDGRVCAWGDNSQYQLKTPFIPRRVVSVACGWYKQIALLENGTVVAWPNISQSGNSFTNIVSVAASGYHFLLLDANGKVYTWIYGSGGDTVAPMPWITNITAIAAMSYGSSMALFGNGAPVFSSHPVSRTVKIGETNLLKGMALGNMPICYQWYQNNLPISGQTNPWVFLPNLQHNDDYWLVASNVSGIATSRVARIAIDTAINLHPFPTNMPCLSNTIVHLSAPLLNPEPNGFSYQWLINGSVPADNAHYQGTDSRELTILGFSTSDINDYSVIITQAQGSITSSIIRLTMATPAQEVAEALDQFDFPVTLTGASQWYYQTNVTFDGLDAAMAGPGTNVATSLKIRDIDQMFVVNIRYKLSSASGSNQLGFSLNSQTSYIRESCDWKLISVPIGSSGFSCTYNNNSSVWSESDYACLDTITFSLPVPPTFIKQPSDTTVIEGGTAVLDAETFQTEATGTHSWYKNGVLLKTWSRNRFTTSAALVLTNATMSDSGNYWLVSSSTYGTNTSQTVKLTVLPMGTQPTLSFTSAAQERFHLNMDAQLGFWPIGTG